MGSGPCLMNSEAPFREQCCNSTVDLSAGTELLYTVPTRAAATWHVWLLSTRNVVSARERLNFSFHLILINFNLWATCG